ncbi:[formate-C-acetyltransferase]-activating enzyme [Photobacterium lipolyticum]|uniref:[formate-C-acetyltransferase]-activating enzyme n=1 Tax=Photobacterium lipolyticum TaxID=266810 RepID=A0A2T3N2I5_9GAMM|nr:[formate-C-acetyltransferase]-activating enzyme [Photobacterium lipolyticum]PSW06563.1 [formate-C-acetyltransferase]-activating enzyme [Photobacterium lipolyticum]
MSCNGISAAPQILNEREGRVFNIQRYSLNDGQGIRTVVFFKGCPLTCPWCANPESRSPKQQMIKREAKCIHCDVCVLDTKESIDECPSGALEVVGNNMTFDEIVAEIEKDSVFFRTSGGGVTLSGGEVMAQAPFAIELAKRLKGLNYPVAIETTGQGNQRHLLALGKLCDEVLYDFKIMDAERAKSITGIDLPKVLDNFNALIKAGVNVIPRLPLIPGYTLDLMNVDRVLRFLQPFELDEIHLLPFHQYGANKYDNLKLNYLLKDVPVPSPNEIEAIRRHVEAAGYQVIIGG